MVAINDIAKKSTIEVACPNCRQITRVSYTFDDPLRDALVLIHVICGECQRPIRESVSAPAPRRTELPIDGSRMKWVRVISEPRPPLSPPP